MKNIIIKVSAAGAYVAMVVVNFLANALPINNQGTGEISDAYSNLFAPAGLTFSIWGLIYLLLGGYVVYQFIKNGSSRNGLFQKINGLFIATSLANLSWIFAWHYDYIGLSVLIMALLLFLLIRIADILRLEKFTAGEKLFIRAPFSVYFGWITVAAIANITVFLVSIGWQGFGIPDFIWTGLILVVGMLIGILRMKRDRDIVYGFVLVWAYSGILLKHVSVNGWSSQYPSIIATVSACLVILLFFIGRLIYKNR